MAYNLLKGKKGLIFGALNEQSIAWKVAERAVEEGAEIVLTNTAVSIRMGTINRLAEKCNTIVIPADATSVEDLETLIDKTMEHFGGKFDFMLHSIGMSPNVRKGRTYDDLDYDYLAKTLDISAISFHKAIQVARKKDAINDWGSIVALTYIAAQRTLYGYNDMADAKALLESIARSFGYIYGREKHVRINTVSQSPTQTTAGSGVLGLGDLMSFAESMSPLGNATAEDCADYVLTLFSDLTRKVTMQNLYHDGGFSSMGMSRRAMKTYEKGMRFDDVHEHQYPFGGGPAEEKWPGSCPAARVPERICRRRRPELLTEKRGDAFPIGMRPLFFCFPPRPGGVVGPGGEGVSRGGRPCGPLRASWAGG